MELQDFTNLDIKTFEPDSPGIKVTVTVREEGIKCEDILKQLAGNLGLKKESLPSFTLCEGHAKPLRRFKKEDFVPIDVKGLSFQKWCFDLTQEKDLIHKDPVATNLIFMQALHDVKSGKFNLSPELAQKLDDCLDPDFPADGQYIKLCHGIPDYTSLQVKNCVVFDDDFDSELSVFPEEVTLDVVMSKYGLRFTDANNDTTFKFTWYELSKWSLNKENKRFRFTFKKQDLDECYVPLATGQVEYMHAGISEMLKLMQKLDKETDVTFHTDMIHTLQDGSMEWSNGFYNPEKAVRFKGKI